MLGYTLDNVRSKKPLIHNITNYVTVNDVANMLLAVGGSPIMADDKLEVEEITSICQGLNINIGTLNSNTIDSMLLAGKKSNLLNHPVILDPVGAGASKLRTMIALRIIDEVKLTVIKGNISEIKTIANGTGTTKGVDADIKDEITEKNLEKNIELAKELSKKTGAVIVITGAIDIVADSKKAYVVRNGKSNMSKITGTGCQLSAMIGAFVTANCEEVLKSTVAAVVCMGYAGELAYELLGIHDGNATYRNKIIDVVYNMTGKMLDKGAKYEIIE